MSNDTQRLSNLINNAIIAVWLNGDPEGAKAKIQFVEEKGPFGQQAKNYGVRIFNIHALSESLAAQFPTCVYVILPTAQALEILKEIGKSRKQTIQNMTDMERAEAARRVHAEQTKDDKWTPDLRDGGISVPGLPDLDSNPLSSMLNK